MDFLWPGIILIRSGVVLVSGRVTSVRIPSRYSTSMGWPVLHTGATVALLWIARMLILSGIIGCIHGVINNPNRKTFPVSIEV